MLKKTKYGINYIRKRAKNVDGNGFFREVSTFIMQLFLEVYKPLESSRSLWPSLWSRGTSTCQGR